jgi:hypothetical protein
MTYPLCSSQKRDKTDFDTFLSSLTRSILEVRYRGAGQHKEGDMGKERMDDPKRLEEIITYLGAIGKEIRTLEKIFGSMAAVRLLFYLVTHGGLRGVVTDSKNTINKECSLTRGKLEAARLELKSKFFIDFETLGNKTGYTLDLACIAGACEAAGIGRSLLLSSISLSTSRPTSRRLRRSCESWTWSGSSAGLDH